MTKQIESPFRSREPVRIKFGILMMMLLTVVAAALGLLVFLALKVPAIASELNAWFGRPVASADSSEARKAKLIFALFTYSAPLVLGMLVFGLHKVLAVLDVATRERTTDADEEFRME